MNEDCGMEYGVQWKGVLYLGTKFRGKEMQPDIFQFVSVLSLKLLGSCGIILLPIHKPSMRLCRNYN